jgi:hypothetical protein
MSDDVNSLLKLYLGTDINGGFQPVGCDERLQHVYPHEHKAKKKLIDRYLEADRTPDWSKHDLLHEGAIFSGMLREQFPELDDVVVRSLANRFMFGWR